MKGREILIVEDNLDHQQLMSIAFRKIGCECSILFASNGIEALNCLFTDGEAATQPRSRLPDIMLVDIKMPFITGFEVLQRVKENIGTRVIPVIMFSSSEEENDVLKAYQLGANSFVKKPTLYAEMIETCQTMRNYWGGLNVSWPVA